MVSVELMAARVTAGGGARSEGAPCPPDPAGTERDHHVGGRVVPAVGAGGRGVFTVLYVEDHPINVSLVRRLVARRPLMRLQVARTGAEAVGLVGCARPDLVLLDLDLPDMSGEVLLEQLWALPGCAQLPVVVLSADAVPDTAARLLARGVTEFLTKPLDVARFYACLDLVAAVPSPRQGHETGRAS
jgi:CheY-like chemotaxis protein